MEKGRTKNQHSQAKSKVINPTEGAKSTKSSKE